MKYLKQGKKKSSFGMVLLVIVLMAAAFGGGIFTGSMLTDEAQPAETTPRQEHTEPAGTTPTVPEETQVQVSDPVYEVQDGDIVAPTPYGEVRYTAEFAEFIRITHEFTREQYAVHFDAALDTGVNARVFSMYFAQDTGRQPDGVLVNTVQAEDGTERLVIVTVNIDFPDSSWDKDMTNLAYAMQEGISDTMEQLSYLQ